MKDTGGQNLCKIGDKINYPAQISPYPTYDILEFII